MMVARPGDSVLLNIENTNLHVLRLKFGGNLNLKSNRKF